MQIKTDDEMIVNGRLRQVGQAFRLGEPIKLWRAVFACECGRHIITSPSEVKRGKSRSCGCSTNRGHDRQTPGKHGHAATAKQSGTYKSWTSMKKRCTNPNDREHWVWCGGRGIVICDRWLNSFEAFLQDMGERPANTTLDRIDSNGNYEPGNCRWATDHQQHRNCRRNRILVAFGKSMCVTDWAIETGIWKTTIKERLNRGWTAEQALTTPVKTRRKKQ